MAEKWSRADKINLWIALIACVGIAVPYGKAIDRHFRRPQATITSPSPDEVMPNNTFGAAGTARNIPQGSDLWIVVRSGDEGRWYPDGRIIVRGNKWTYARWQLCTGYGVQYLQVFLVTFSAEKDLFSFIRSSARQQEKGVNSMPPGARLEYSRRIKVRPSRRKFC